MFDFSPQTLIIFATALAVGAIMAARQPGGILAALARNATGFAVRGLLGLVIFGAIYAYATSDRGGAALGTKDPLEKAKVGDCVAGSTQSTTRLVPCDDAFAKTQIVKIFQDTPAAAAMSATACGGVDAADSAFTVSEVSGDSGDAVAYCTKTLQS